MDELVERSHNEEIAITLRCQSDELGSTGTLVVDGLDQAIWSPSGSGRSATESPCRREQQAKP